MKTKFHTKVLAIFYVFGILLFLKDITYAQSDQIHVTADTLNNIVKDGQTVVELKGHFEFYQGSLTGRADRAIRYPEKNVVELFGNVVLRQDTLSLNAPHVTYDGTDGSAKADGHVQFSDRDDHITSDWATYNLTSGVADFHTNVRAIQGSTTLTSNELSYIRSTQTLFAKGNVFVVNDSGTLRCDTLVDARTLGERTAIGNVKASNDSLIIYCGTLYESQHDHKTIAATNVQAYSIANRTIQYGDTLVRNSETGHTVVPSRPVLLIIDSTQHIDSLDTTLTTTTFDTLLIRSNSMEAFPGDSGLFIATDSVLLLRGNFSGKCTKLIYHKAEGIMAMFGASRQRIWYDSTEIDGDSIVLYQRDNKPRMIKAFGNAFATTPFSDSLTTGRVSQLSSKTMTVAIEQDTVRSLLAVDNALSIYFVSDNGKPNGLNRSSGDTLRIDFEHNAARRIVILSGTEGEFWPERFVGTRGAAFRFGNYERQYESRPRKRWFELDWIPLPFAM